ncbi:unnamed protein product [Darwinula stevensoni]|uniref:GTP-binding protein 10 n=1 Tax=Darwinula stevensoni TaxID=69355 RepID=A0A7R8X3W2_9CRUS|nr:unnamed protein product [Darwinula stevensoni]CAG0882979.1 unnamed protein product [Darwinula stevensoni]
METVKKVRKAFRRHFIDVLRLYVMGGTGGNGLPRYGGIGGPGGNVYVVAKEDTTLKVLVKKHPNKRFKAGMGGNSHKYHILGTPGENIHIPAPVGVIVKTDHGACLGSLDVAGEKVLVAKGGLGGNPINNFLGQKAVPNFVTLELKLIADVGLVGFPNAGKSTLLRAISQAKPTVASYPFTTIQPQLGQIVYPDKRTITVADLPGLIEGAHVNRGMGHSFLRHVERTKLLLFVVDIMGFQLGTRFTYRSPLETVLLLNRELELYRDDLVSKPALLAVNKMDSPQARRYLNKLLADLRLVQEGTLDIADHLRPLQFIQFDEVIPMSAKTDPGSLEYIKLRIRKVLDFHEELHRNETSRSCGLVEQCDHLPVFA